MQSNFPILETKNLKTQFFTEEGIVRAVDDISFEVGSGEVVGIVGESGCGKSVLARSIMRLLRPPGRTVDGQIIYHRPGTSDSGTDLVSLDDDGDEIRSIRGGDITMIFQEPMASFSLVHTVGNQIIEGILNHQDLSKNEARNLAIEMLGKVGIPNPENRIDDYPFTLSGGMRQRCMIAMALVNHPKLIIADEPTTALDVTTQAQILELMAEIQSEFGMAMILISHNLGVIAQMAEKVIVMYLGKIVEQGDVTSIFNHPKHPYTQELLKSIPKLGRIRSTEKLSVIDGTVPPAYSIPSGCSFHPRCPKFVSGMCEVNDPTPISIEPNHTANCLLYSEAFKEGPVK